MNLTYIITSIILAIVGSACMTYFENARSQRLVKKKRKKKMKVA